MPDDWRAAFCDGAKLAPWRFGSAHHDQGILFWWYALRRGSFRDLHCYPFYDAGQLNHTYHRLSTFFVPHVHFGGSPKPWSNALLGYQPYVWHGKWGYPKAINVKDIYSQIGAQHSFPLIREGLVTSRRKEALAWYRKYFSYYERLLLARSGKPLPPRCGQPFRRISDRIAELWEIAKGDPNDFAPFAWHDHVK